MRKIYTVVALCLLYVTAFTQIVTLTPTDAGADDAATITFDASEGDGDLVGAAKVYLHHGAVIDAPDGTDWTHVIGNWGEDDGVGQMTKVGEDLWELQMTPSIREHFGVAANEDIFRISAVFRSADGSIKGTIAPGDYGWGTVVPGGDFYINLNTSNYVSINAPTGSNEFVENGDSIRINVTASANVSKMVLSLDEGSGITAVDSISTGTFIEYYYKPSSTVNLGIYVTAEIDGEDFEAESNYNIVITQATNIAELPVGVEHGINYSETNDTSVILVLEAPGKDYGYVVGDFTNWNVLDEYQMNQTSDGEFLWLEVNGLVPMQEYVFQYWVDGDVKIGDPYADKVADPWNDQWIDSTTYPNLPEYTFTDYEIATVLQTGQTPYEWAATEDTWVRPDVDHLVIYELLVRDFLESHSYTDLIDTLDYLVDLGIDAIELMPFNEFEGNESWGYNPSYYFAPDKYYGTKDQLKQFIEEAHARGLAVIMDMVLNHAYGQNALVKLYSNNGVPTSDNPWFNYPAPEGHFTWGYDFDHESQYTKDFIDRVNKYWIEEYHVDGYRFDFTKGFTNSTSPDSYDAARIANLKRMADTIWATDPDAYVILEHWGPSNEESELAGYGMKLWRNKSYDFVPAITGSGAGDFRGMDDLSHVSYFNSHDERRIAEHALSEGLSSADGSYNVKDPIIMYERVKMAAAFAYLYPGPKMIWQFDELGYDIHIDFNGRVGNKPLPWGEDGLGYYEDELRQHIYSAYQGILDVRNTIGAENLEAATKAHKYTGTTKRMSYDTDGTDLVVIANFGLEEATIDPEFTQTGTWYDYFGGGEHDVSDVNQNITLQAGEWYIYTTTRLSDGMPGVVETFSNPVTVSPFPFTKDDEITITFDAGKAFTDGTDGLVGASEVYMYSGVILNDPSNTTLEKVVNDANAQMTNVEGDIWEITLTPSDYYSLSEDDLAFKLGMYFRDADETNVGKGFRNSNVLVNIASNEPLVKVEPESFAMDEQITITFNANAGDQGLLGHDEVYMHTGVVLSNIASPTGSDWSNVPGDWGDNSWGALSPVDGKPGFWEITMVPEDFYSLGDGDFAYWIAAVFRSADGNTKGSDAQGEYDFGIIVSGGDVFIKNQASVSVGSVNMNPKQLEMHPNPTTGIVTLSNANLVNVVIYSSVGSIVRTITNENISEVNISDLENGIYFIQSTDANNTIYTGKIIKTE
jgi:glycosidase